MPADLVSVDARIPAGWTAKRVETAELPRNWRAYPAPPALAALGTSWARSLETPGLWVPSAVIPEEWNLLINPKHPEFRRLSFERARPFRFDPRMWK